MANTDRDFPAGEPVTGDETEVDLNEVERLLREEDDKAGRNKDKKTEAAGDVVVEEEGDAKLKEAAASEEEQEGHETARTEEERELIRERRRNEKKTRKQRQRDRVDEKDRTISVLNRNLQEVLTRLEAVENRSTSSDMARLDEAIEQAGHQVEAAKAAFLDSGDDKARQLEVQEVMYQARSRLEHLQNIKARINQASADRGNNGVRKVDPAVRKHGSAWMTENKWYDSTGKDADSQIVRTIDANLVQEGWDPRTPEYWDELSSRAKRYLPHKFSRYNPGKKDADEQDDDLNTDQNEQDGAQEARRKSITAGSGRDNPGAGASKKTFKISADRVAAMKEAGIWDDPVARAKQVKAYIAYDKQHATN